MTMEMKMDEKFEEGKKAGSDEKTRAIVLNMIKSGISDTEILKLAECDQGFVDEMRSGME